LRKQYRGIYFYAGLTCDPRFPAVGDGVQYVIFTTRTLSHTLLPAVTYL
jgi:hypothetical protein